VRGESGGRQSEERVEGEEEEEREEGDQRGERGWRGEMRGRGRRSEREGKGGRRGLEECIQSIFFGLCPQIFSPFFFFFFLPTLSFLILFYA
jgi:hypothetical protein